MGLYPEFVPPIKARSMRHSQQKRRKKMGLFRTYAADEGQVDGRKVAQSLQKL